LANFSNIKLIGVDLDGTLLNSEGRVTDATLKAIDELHKRGVLLVPTTGRSFFATHKSLTQNPAVEYVISSDGAAIDCKKTGERNLVEIDEKKLELIYKVLNKYTVVYINHVLGKDAISNSDAKEEYVESFGFSDYYKSFIRECTYKTDSLEELFGPLGVECVCAFFKCTEDYEAAIKELNTIKGIQVVHSVKNSVEIIDSRAGKGNGILRLAKSLGIENEQVAVFGDSNNDISMIRAFENSFCMENGAADVKKEAGYIACSNDDCLGEYILKLLDGKIVPKKGGRQI